jgi:hypothetical protein
MAAVVGVLIAAPMWGGEPPPAAAPQAAVERAIAYFGRDVATGDPRWIGLFAYLERRFGVEVRLASGEPAHGAGTGVARGKMQNIYRRLDDPAATTEKKVIADLPHVIDRITASALHCDRIALPAEWLEILAKAAHAGGYALTHAALALEWTVENGCANRQAVEVAALRDEQVRLLVGLVDGRADLARHFETDADLWIEAVAMLYYVGARGAVRPEWLRELVDLQLPSGAWAAAKRGVRADPHATALALWVLLEATRQPAAIPWIVPSS